MILPAINRTLLPLKAAYFFYFFSFIGVVPFLPVFFRQIGLDAEQAGIINGSRLFIQCLTNPLWGMVADKKRKHRLLLLIQIIGASLLMFSTPWIVKILPNNINTLCTVTEGQNLTAYQLHQVNKTKNTDHQNLLENINTNHSNNTNNSSCQGVMNVYLFPIILIVLIIAAIFDGGIPLLLDTLLMDMIKSGTDGNKIDFGKQRLWGALGYVLASLSTGLGVQLSGSGKANYLTMFYIYLASNICLLIVCLKIRQSDDESVGKKEKPDIGKGLLYILKHFHATFFFSTIFVEGFANALILGFLFWYIKDLGGTEILMGASNIVAGTSNVIAFVITKRFIKFVGGNLNAINLGVISYAVRFLAMSYVTNAWHILFLQLFQGICFAILWSAATAHASVLAPPGLTTTFIGILNGIHFGMSAGVSIILGGIWYKSYGGRSLFRSFSIVCAIWSMIVFLYVLSRKRKEKQKVKLGDNELTAIDDETGPKPVILVNTHAMKDNP